MSNKADYHFYIAHGLCGSCGKRELFSKASCLPCLISRRKAMHRITGYKPWTRGGPGGWPTEFRMELEKR